MPFPVREEYRNADNKTINVAHHYSPGGVPTRIVQPQREDLSETASTIYSRASLSGQTAESTQYYPDDGSVRSIPISRISTSVSHKSSQAQAPGGFRHQSDTHVTYNIKSKDGGRQLFVSAPVGSAEADVHDQVASRAASVASVSGSYLRSGLGLMCKQSARIQGAGSQREGGRGRWIKF
jgi:hypothetical protein